MSLFRWPLLAVWLLLVPVAGSAGPATDLHGDALPASAVARLGTVRLRHGCDALAFAPGGTVLASAGTDHRVRLWEVSSGKELLRLEGHTHYVSAIAFSADGKTLVSASLDGTLRVWEAANGKLVRSFGSGKPELAVLALVIAPDRRTLITAGWDRTVRVWDLTTGKEQKALTDHRATTVRVALSPDGKHFATTGPGGAVVVREVASSKQA